MAQHDPTDWESMWKNGLSRGTAFDGGAASPALVGYLNRVKSTATTATTATTPKTALVPGAGRAWDAAALAEHGFQVQAWDIARSAVVEAQLQVNETPFASSIAVVHQDFFVSVKGEEQFDLIWDCTFLCALPSSSRQAWAQRHAALLKPGGSLVCLVFPMFPADHPKVTSGSGPPFALNGQLLKDLLVTSELGFEVVDEIIPLPKEENHLPGRMPAGSGLLVFAKEKGRGGL